MGRRFKGAMSRYIVQLFVMHKVKEEIAAQKRTRIVMIQTDYK